MSLSLLSRRQLAAGRTMLARPPVCGTSLAVLERSLATDTAAGQTKPGPLYRTAPSFENAYEWLQERTVKKAAAKRVQGKLTQEELLTGQRSGAVDAEAKRGHQTLTRPSVRVISTLTDHASTKEQVELAKAELRRLLESNLFRLPAKKNKEIVRVWILRGHFPAVSELLANRRLYGITIDEDVALEYMRAMAIRANALKWNISHTLKIDRAHRRSRYRSFQPWTKTRLAGQALYGMASMATNTAPADGSEHAQAHKEYFDRTIASLMQEVSENFEHSSKVLQYDEGIHRSRKDYLAAVQRDLIDFELTINGLKAAAVLTNEPALFGREISQLADDINKMQLLIEEGAQEFGTTTFTSLSIERYAQVFLAEKNGTETQEKSEDEN